MYGLRGTPTTTALEAALNDLEGSAGTILVPSGLAAISVPLLAFLSHGDHCLVIDSVYGPTRHFCDTMLKRMGALRDEAAHGGKQAVLCGDFNIAHTPLDIKNAKANEKHAGFLPEERAYVDKWLDEYEFVDVMRSLAGDIQGPYTWWSQRGRAFDNNVGWRIDYQFATPELAETARGFVIDKAPTYDKRWSDHAPLTITYEV